MIAVVKTEREGRLLNRLRVARAERDLSQGRLAAAVGVRRQTISSIETAQYCPSTALAFRLAHTLGVRVDEIFLARRRGPMNRLLMRDERPRESSVDRTVDRLAHLVLSFGLLAIVAYRSFAQGEASWDLLGLVVLGTSMNWRGRPLTSHEVIVELIAATTTRTGLTVRAELDEGTYPKMGSR